MDNLLIKIKNDKDFMNIISDIIENKTVQEMKNYRQHYQTSCFEHCLVASYFCYLYCKKQHLDYFSCARAAMLHDLFLYDWRKRLDGRKGLHAFTHPITAYENASKLFNLNDKEKDIILKHMWPVTLPFPRYIESFIITLTDKYCASKEIFDYYNRKKFKPLYRYAYIFAFIIFSHV